MNSRAFRIMTGRSAALSIFIMSCAGSLFASIMDLDTLLDKQFGATTKLTVAQTKAFFKSDVLPNLKTGDVLLMPRNTTNHPTPQDTLSDGSKKTRWNLSTAPNGLEIAYGSLFFGGNNSGHNIHHASVDVAEGGYLSNSFIYLAGGSGISGGPYDNVHIQNWTRFYPSTFTWPTPFINSSVVYWSSNQNKANYTHFLFKGNMANSVFVNMVQTNYCNQHPQVMLTNLEGATFLGGDNERSSGTNFLFNACKKVNLVAIRNFHSHGTSCTNGNADYGIKVMNCDSMNFIYSQCIGNPIKSMLIQNSPNFFHFGGSWERPVDVDSVSDATMLKAFFTPDLFGSAPLNTWVEPVNVSKEVIFTYKGQDLTTGNAKRLQVPPPPCIPTVRINKNMDWHWKDHLADWGRALIDVYNADPTGQTQCDAAFAAYMADTLYCKSVIKVPEGTFLLTNSLAVNKRIEGRGMTKSILKLNRTDVALIDFTSKNSVSDIRLEGGKYGIDWTNLYIAGQSVLNVYFKGQSIAGIKGGNDLFYQTTGISSANAHEFDQNTFWNCVFDQTGRFGIQVNMGMTDKQQFYNCKFIGQTEAGISYPCTQMFAGSIIGCHFENINGPAIDMYPRDPSSRNNGYGIHCSTIEGCTIIECGSDSMPAIDWDWTESGSVTNTTITLKTKPWKYAFRGTGQYFYEVDIDVDVSKMISGGAALALRHTRHLKNARPTGNILRGVKSNGPLAFINDAPANMAMPENVDPPLGDWAYPHLFYDCLFSNKDYSVATGKKMVLVNTEKSGAIKAEIELDPSNAPCAPPAGARYTAPGSLGASTRVSRSWQVYDLSGRKVASLQSRQHQAIKALRLPRGMYVIRGVAGTHAVKFCITK